MTKLDAIAVTKYTTKDGQEKSRWRNVGVAFESEKIGGWSIKFDGPVVFLPGMSDLVLATPKPKDGEGI
jgi:ketosteroid isomerase-like protein